MTGNAEIVDTLEQVLRQLRQRPARRGWMDQFQRGEVLTLSRAASVADVHPETIRRWCEQTIGTDRPIGYLIGSLWLIDLGELLHFIEVHRGGLPARLAARTRWEKQVKTWSTPLRLNVERAEVEPTHGWRDGI